MKKDKTYRIIVENVVYSKKKGSYQVCHIWQRDVATLDLCKQLIQKHYPAAKEDTIRDYNKGVILKYRMPGMLGPSFIYVK